MTDKSPDALVEQIRTAVEDYDERIYGLALRAASELERLQGELAAAKKRIADLEADSFEKAHDAAVMEGERDRMREALQRIMYARCDPASPITNMSRAGMRELAAAALGLPTE